MTDTTEITFYGMSQFVGQTATVSVVGLDCGDYPVASDGSVTVPYGSDPDGLLTADYLISLSATPPDSVYGWGELAATFYVTPSGGEKTQIILPVVIGFNYISQGQVVRPMSQDDIKSPVGSGLGKTRRNQMYSALLSQTQHISFGGDFANLRAATFQTNTGVSYQFHTLYTGVYWDILDDDYSLDGMLSWEVGRPYPALAAAATGFLSTQDR